MLKVHDWMRHWSRQQTPSDALGRRRFLAQSIWTAVGLGLGAHFGNPASAQDPKRVRFVADPFALGVASAYPHPNGFSLWTRLAPAPWLANGGMGEERVPVRCEIADDEAFRNIQQSLNFETAPEVAHSVHLDISGLAPGRRYFYRFLSGDAVSAVGRTHTLPAAGSALDHYRIAFASCQNFEHGFFSAYRQMQRDEPDLVLFLGDYIYESQWGDNPIRRHLGGEPTTLDAYRIRHAQYKLDPDLQAMHQAAPWAFAWDDHEVDNDYAGEQSENLDPAFVMRRAAAYQAFFEHLPMPRRMFPRATGMRIYTDFDIGDLLRVYLLDDRQYRTPQACPRLNRHSSQTLSDCQEFLDPTQTLLGSEQEAWLAGRFAQSKLPWNLIAQQTLVAPMDESPGAERSVWTDGWDGYPLARQRLLGDITKHQLKNPIIAGGDIHCAIVASVPSDPKQFDSAPLASEFVATSISADGWPQDHYDATPAAENPHLLQTRSDQRGYTLFDFDRKRLSAKLQVVSDVRVRDPQFGTQARYVVESGRAGPQKA